jgi:predicted porin
MKKTLIAMAVLAASGASFAQSSVTLYGVVDVSIADTDKAGLDLANDKTQLSSSGTLNNGTSRFGLRGTEDLGGGLSAKFNFESPTNAVSGSTGLAFTRQAWVSLAGGFGEVRAGRQFSSTYYAVDNFELTGTANYSAYAKQFSYAGPSRDSAALAYMSPSFGGFKVIADVVMEGNAVYGTAADPKSKYDLAAIYKAGPIAASLAYNKVTDGDQGTVLGGSYDLTVAKVALSFTSVKNGAGDKKTEGYTLGVSAPVGPVTLTADFAVDTIDRAASRNDTDFVLEAKYPLSKRTFVYAAYLQDGKGKTAENVSGYAVGLRHNF